MKHIVTLSFLFTSCIVAPNKPTPKPTPSPSPTVVVTARPTLPPPIPPFPIPTVDTTAFELVELPFEVLEGVPFSIKAKAKEMDSVNVWIDNKWQVGKMFWDAEKKLKYLNVKVTGKGERSISFKVNGEVLESRLLLVK